MSIKIVQSQTVFHVLNLNTLRAALVDGVQVFKDEANGLDLPAANLSLSEVLIVLPVTPQAGDKVVSIHEGDLVTGVVLGDHIQGGFVIEYEGVGLVRLSRNQFHVTEAITTLDHGALYVGDELVVIDGGNGNFPHGTIATVQNIAQTKGIPSLRVVLAKNNLDWTWDAQGVGFRLLDKTVIDFDFPGEIEDATLADVAKTDAPFVPVSGIDHLPETVFQENEEAMDAVTNEALEQALDNTDFNADEPVNTEALGLTTADLPDDLKSEHLDFVITDADGNRISWADLPEAVQASLRGVIGDVTELLEPLAIAGVSADELPDDLGATLAAALNGNVVAQEELADATDDDKDEFPGSPDDFLDAMFGALFGPSLAAMFAAAQEEARQAEVQNLAAASVEAEADHKEFVADSYGEIEEHNTDAIRSITLATNLLGRMIKSRAPTDPALAEQLVQINTLLHSARNAQFNVDKAILDATTDIDVTAAIQANIEGRAASLIH